MTEIEAYQEYIRCKHNAFCKAVIRYAAIGKIIRLRQKWEREISLDYLTNEKFVQFAEPEPDEEHPFTVCGQTVLLSNAALADAISVLPEQTQEEIFRYYFLRQQQRVIGVHIGRTRSTICEPTISAACSGAAWESGKATLRAVSQMPSWRKKSPST